MFKVRTYIISKVELLIQTRLKFTDTNFRPIHEDNRRLQNDAEQKSFMRTPKINFILTSEVIR